MLKDYFPELIEVSYDELIEIFDGYVYDELFKSNMSKDTYWEIINAFLSNRISKYFNLSREGLRLKLNGYFPGFKNIPKMSYKHKLFKLINVIQCPVCKKFYRVENYIVMREFICFDCIKSVVPKYLREYLHKMSVKKCTVCKEYKDYSEFYPINTGCKIDHMCKECRKKKSIKYNKEHPEKLKASTAKYRANKIQRTPKWAEPKDIEEFYKNCPEGYHVDHIIPLQGKNVSGLHCLANLQYLTPEENLRKSNKYEPKILIKGIDY